MQIFVVTPDSAKSAVGRYGLHLGEAFQNEGHEVEFVSTFGPGQDTALSTLKICRSIYRSMSKNSNLYIDLSAGSFSPFVIAAYFSRKMPTVVTIHDPPHVLWWPLSTNFVFKNYFLKHLLNFPIRRFWYWIELRLLRKCHCVLLNRASSDAISKVIKKTFIIPHFVEEPKLHHPKASISQKLTIGLYGFTYKGKGFDQVPEIRRLLSSNWKIIVAGYGTEKLPGVVGVSYRGSLTEKEEASFFHELDFLILPYNRRSRYGVFTSSSGAMAKAFSFSVPVLSLSNKAFDSETFSGAVAQFESLRTMCGHLTSSEYDMGALRRDVETLALSRQLDTTAKKYLELFQC